MHSCLFLCLCLCLREKATLSNLRGQFSVSRDRREKGEGERECVYVRLRKDSIFFLKFLLQNWGGEEIEEERERENKRERKKGQTGRGGGIERESE